MNVLDDTNKTTRNSQNWGTVTLGDDSLFSVGTGGTPSTSQPQYWDGNIPWVTPTDLSNLGTAVISETARTITPEGVVNSSAKPLPVGSIVISTRAPIGYATILGKEMSINQGCKAIVVKDPSKVSNEYLYFNLLTQTQKMKELGSGSTFRELSQHNLKSIEVLLPEISEQQNIASFLGGLKKLLEKQSNVIALKKELRVALTQKLFTEGIGGKKQVKTEIGLLPEDWQLLRFSDVADIKQGQVDPKKDPYRDMVHVGPENIESGTGSLNAKSTNAELNIGSGNYLFTEEDILYSKIRPYLNKVALATFTGTCSADMYPIRPKDKIVTKEFLFHLMISSVFCDQAIASQARTGIPKINREQLNSVKIPVPTIREQISIAEILSVCDESILKEQVKRNFYQELFDLMLDKLINGEISIKDLSVY